VKSQSCVVKLQGAFTNCTENQRENKKIDDLGQISVMQYEQERLRVLVINKKPLHKAIKEGDGLGYDMLSYNDAGQEIYIEVKTTIGRMDAPFFITKN